MQLLRKPLRPDPVAVGISLILPPEAGGPLAGEGLSSTPKALPYAGLSVSLGLLAQYPTVWHSHLAGWVARIPFVFFQYFLIVVAFTSFIFSGGWRGGQLPLLLLFAKYSCGFL